jgi:hypothetical protein
MNGQTESHFSQVRQFFTKPTQQQFSGGFPVAGPVG